MVTRYTTLCALLLAFSTSLYADTPPAPGLLDSFSSLGQRLGLSGKGGGKQFLDPDQAFVMTVDAVSGNQLRASWEIAEGYYLYREKFRVTVTQPAGISAAPLNPPPGDAKADPNFGEVRVFHRRVAIDVPLTRTDLGTEQPLNLTVNYQGCADAGFCYPPITKMVTLTLPARGIATAPTAEAAPLPEQDRFAQSLRSNNLTLTLAAFFGAGLLLAFTPCMFPMIPILSSIVVGQGGPVKTRRAFSLSLIYVLAMAATYTAAGVIAGRSGANLQAALQNPWVLGSFAALFVALALSMFGLYALQMPARWQSRLSDLSNRQRGGSYAGVVVMGVLSALIVGPCLAAPLAGALIYISQQGDPWLGGSALFALSMGMGLPLLLIGTVAGRLLPRAGAWMEAVKGVFGVLLLGLAVWMLERVLPSAITMALWAVLLIVSAVYMGALERLEPEATGWRKLWKGIGLVLLIYGSLLMLGAVSGGKDVLQPLRGLTLAAGAAPRAEALPFKPVKGLEGLQREVAAAHAAGQAVMLDFYADWCISCKEMERDAFSDARVRAALANVVLLRADVTANDAADQALLRQYGLFGPPTILFFGADGVERHAQRIIGIMDATQFTAHLQRALQPGGAST